MKDHSIYSQTNSTSEGTLKRGQSSGFRLFNAEKILISSSYHKYPGRY